MSKAELPSPIVTIKIFLHSEWFWQWWRKSFDKLQTHAKLYNEKPRKRRNQGVIGWFRFFFSLANRLGHLVHWFLFRWTFFLCLRSSTLLANDLRQTSQVVSDPRLSISSWSEWQVLRWSSLSVYLSNSVWETGQLGFTSWRVLWIVVVLFEIIIWICSSNLS